MSTTLSVNATLLSEPWATVVHNRVNNLVQGQHCGISPLWHNWNVRHSVEGTERGENTCDLDCIPPAGPTGCVPWQSAASTHPWAIAHKAPELRRFHQLVLRLRHRSAENACLGNPRNLHPLFRHLRLGNKEEWEKGVGTSTSFSASCVSRHKRRVGTSLGKILGTSITGSATTS